MDMTAKYDPYLAFALHNSSLPSVQVLLEGMKLIRRLTKVSPLAEYLLDSDIPKNFDNLSDDQLNEHIDKCQ